MGPDRAGLPAAGYHHIGNGGLARLGADSCWHLLIQPAAVQSLSNAQRFAYVLEGV